MRCSYNDHLFPDFGLCMVECPKCYKPVFELMTIAAVR